MTKQTKNERELDLFREGAVQLAARLETSHYTTKNDVYKQSWSPEELAQYEATRGLFHPDSFDRPTIRFERIVHLDASDYPLPSDKTARLQFTVNARQNMVLPLIPSGFDAELQLMAKTAYEKGLFMRVVNWLKDNCKDLAQVRYLFPPVLACLRTQGLYDLASSIESIKPQKNMPSLPFQERQELKWIIQWFTIQQLVGVFEGPKVTPNRSGYDVVLQIYGDQKQYVLVEDEDRPDCGQTITIPFNT